MATTVTIRCHICRAQRSQKGGTPVSLRKKARRNGWSAGLLDWSRDAWSYVDRCGRCTREHGEPRPIGPPEGTNWGKRPHPRPVSEA